MYYLIVGVLGILFAFTHAWNGLSIVLPILEVTTIPLGMQMEFKYVWHIITAENLIFGMAFLFMSFQKEQSKFRFAAWLMITILFVRLIVILGITAMLNVSSMKDTLLDSIAIILYIALMIRGATLQKKQDAREQLQKKT